MVAAAPALAKPAYVATTVNLRAAPGTTSEIVGKIPGGSLIDAKDCSEGWCAVTWQDKSGFAIQTALDMSGRVPQRAAGPPPGYAPRGVYVEEETGLCTGRRRAIITAVPITVLIIGRIGDGAGTGEERLNRPAFRSFCRRPRCRPIASLTAR